MARAGEVEAALDRGWVQAVEEGAVVVTATRRLARHLVAQYDAAQAGAGRTCWETPRVLPWSAWLTRLWEDTWPAEALLSEAASLALWEDAIARDAATSGADVLDIPATARLARQAHDLLLLYEIPFAAGQFDAPEPRAMGRWLATYRERRTRGGWVEQVELPARLGEAAERGRLPRLAPVLLAGFDEPVPAQDRLLRAFQGCGCRVTALPFPSRSERALRTRRPDGPGEVRAAARWVRGLLEAGTPPGRIGVVGVALEAYAPWIERIFAEELVPSSVLPGRAGGALPFDLSYGGALSREPVVAAALDLLGIGPGAESWEAWSSLLRSPFWADVDEGLGRAALDADLSRERCALLGGFDLAHRARQRGLEETAAGLDALTRAARESGPPRPPSAWGGVFHAVLQACGWTGAAARALSSREFQARQAFVEALAGLRALDVVVGEVSRGWALDRLRRLCAAPFRPEARGEVVPVLGHLQAAGLDFDHLWVLGLRAGAWPPEATPNPFLPYGLLASHGVREAIPEAQLAAARGGLNRLIESAPDVVLSYPATWEGTEVFPSPLVGDVPEGEPPLGESASLREMLRREAAALEAVADEAPPLETSFSVRRGPELLADQAACPFRAFARHRLAAEGLATPDVALDALERGVAVHRCLERFWEVVGGSEALHALSETELDAVVARAVEAGLAALDEGRAAISARVRALEGRRLGALLREWLEVERAREPFRVVAREDRREAGVGGLRFRVRVDRVDELGDGRRVLVDYKTGRPRPARWFEERPREPQLPLYALACPEACGIGYAVLRRGECARKEVREAEGALRGLPAGEGDLTRWSELREHWRQRLGVLAEEVLRGRADVAPLDAEVCGFCELLSLCRVSEGAHGDLGEETG